MISEKVLKSALFVFVISSFFPIFLLKTPTVRSATDHVVISEIQTTGGTGLTNNEFVEIYNPTSVDIDITNWKLTKKPPAAGSESVLVEDFPSMSIKAHGYVLIVHEDHTISPAADFTYNADILSDSNTILIYDAGDVLVDKVGMGTASDSETTPAQNPLSGKSIERKAKSTSTTISMETGGDDEFLGNGHDTNDNSNDIVRRTFSEPQNASSDIEPEISTPTPTPTGSPTTEPTATATPTPSSSPTSEPTDTPSPTPSPTPEPTDTPSPTPSATPEETPSPTPEATPTSEPTETPEPTVTPTPTASPTMKPTPTPTPTSRSMVIGMFLFPRRKTVCTMTYRFYGRGFMRFVFPRISCTRVI